MCSFLFLSFFLVSVIDAKIPHGSEFGGGPFLYTNIGPTLRQWFDSNGKAVPVDQNNWPTTDCTTVVFDNRPFPEWQCNSDPHKCCDDPWIYEPPLNGTYTFTLQGKATVQGIQGVSLTYSFDSTKFVTSGSFTLVDRDVAVVGFTATQRTANSPTGSGFTNLRVLRPGHASDPDRTWSPELLQLIQPLDHLRFMGISGTNTNPGYYGDAGHHYLEWTNRCLPTDALWPNDVRPGCWGMPWEDVILLSQAAKKGVWVNLPVSATLNLAGGVANTSCYAYKWASLLKNGNEFTGGKGIGNVPIYVEHSNEVWNFGFGQYIWNKLAAIDECKSSCLWNNDGSTDQEVWAMRRHAGKVYELSRTFAAVFGEAAVPNQVRPILAEWTIFPQHYSDLLTWFSKTYGAPSKYLYAIAIDGYFGGDNSAPNMTVDQIYATYSSSTSKLADIRKKYNDLATQWGLKVVAYEAGPGWTVGSTNNVQNYILAQRFAPMRKVIVGDVAGWTAAGPAMDAYNHFSLVGLPSRFGMWGHVESFFNLTTPKWCGVLDSVGAPLPQGCKW